MNKLYIARSYESEKIVTFTEFWQLEEFAEEHRYAYDYFAIPIIEEYSDVNLFLNRDND